MKPWLIRKRADGDWTIWRWSVGECRYVDASTVPTGAQALELYAAAAP